MSADIERFHMPRYREIPNVGLYLEQVTRYINGFLAPLGCVEITASMVSNYVKKGYVSNPVKKQYYAEQIAYLFFLAVAKNALSIENIGRLFAMQKQICTPELAYDNFCQELEDTLRSTFGLENAGPPADSGEGDARQMLHSTIVAVANIIYLSHRFDERKAEEAKKAGSRARDPAK